MSEVNRDARTAASTPDVADSVRRHVRRQGGSMMPRCIAAAMLAAGLGLTVAAPAYSLDYEAGPPGARVVARVAVTRFPALPPNPCVRLPNLAFADNPVLPPNPCFADRRERS